MRKPYGHKNKYHDFRVKSKNWSIEREDDSILFLGVKGSGTGIKEGDNIVIAHDDKFIRYYVHNIFYKNKIEFTALLIFLCYE